MDSCPRCGRKLEAVTEKCVCGFDLRQPSEKDSPQRDIAPERAEDRPSASSAQSAGAANASPSLTGSTPAASSESRAGGGAPAAAPPASPPATKESDEGELEAEDEGEATEDEELEAEEPDSEKKALHEEEDAEDVENDKELEAEEEAEDVEEGVSRRKATRRHSWIANVVGIGVNAILLLIVIWLVKSKLLKEQKPQEEAPPESAQTQVEPPPKPEYDPGAAPPPPAVAIQGEYVSLQGTPARQVEDVLRAKPLMCRIEKLRFLPGSGTLAIVLRKDAFWDVKEVKAAADHDCLLVFRTVFSAKDTKYISLTVEARMDKKLGEAPFETVLTLVVSKEAFDASGLAHNEAETLPSSLRPKYHPKLAGVK